MADIAPALATSVAVLSQFENKAVRQVGVEIPGAAGGLRESMRIEPREFHQGERVHIVLACDVTKVRFEPIDKDDPAGDQRRVHVFAVDEATIVDAELVSAQLDEQRERLAKAKRDAAGTPTFDDQIDQLIAQHESGDHQELQSDCPSCQEERDAMEAERE